ncbi:uncharacterized protein [Diadema antillarum]|uniref:uncharacterized protein n=1 Tax=Diadema antillarum TaxID=105358 RepID=UPI003A849C0D
MDASSSRESLVGNADQPRFDLLTEDELQEFINSSDSANTKKQIRYGVSVFTDFCQQIKTDFENVTNPELDVLLSKFYAGARNKKGAHYSAKSMQGIRFALQRHFMVSRNIDIIKAKEFSLSNKTFKALLGKLKACGKGSVKHHPPISAKDMTLIQASLDLNTAKGLQDKVFLDVMLHFANRGMENLRAMKPEDFILHQQGNNDEFFTLRDMRTKNHQDDDAESQKGQMHSLPGNPRCPVTNLKRYLSKLNPKCSCMWQRPRERVTEEEVVWYANVPLGKNTLATMTKMLSEKAGCSKSYTNHSLRATCVTLLDHAGYASRDIMTVSGHRSETSIKNYVRTSEDLKRKMSDTISANINAGMADLEEVLPDDVLEKNVHSNAPHPSTATTDPINDDTDLVIFTDSQLESIEGVVMNELPNTVPLHDITNFSSVETATTSGYAMNMNMVNSVQPQYNFHGCTVNIYNVSN